MSEQRQEVGVCQGITEKPSGWYEFEINVENLQYPLKLSTKKAEIVEAVRAVGSDVATWTFTERDSDRINEHTQKPFKNRYLDSVEAGSHATAPANSGASSAKGDALSKEEWRQKDAAADKRACIAIAASLLPHLGPEPSDEELEAAVGRVLFMAHRFHTNVNRQRQEPPFE